MNLIINKETADNDFDEIIEKAALAALCCEGVEENCQISVTLCDNEEITRLNEAYMGRVGPTDVLSFPMMEFDEAGRMLPSSMTYDGDELLLGDIVISLEKAKAQAEEYGHSLRREVGFLTIHSMLHLLGFDHNEDEEREAMQREEKKILSAIDLPRK